MEFSKFRKCELPGYVLEISKCPADVEVTKELYGEEVSEMYHITCHHGKISTGSSGRTLEEVVESWNSGRPCKEFVDSLLNDPEYIERMKEFEERE